MARDLSKYTYKNFLKNGQQIEKYYDGKTKIVICKNSIKQSQNKEKKILINQNTKDVTIEF